MSEKHLLLTVCHKICVAYLAKNHVNSCDLGDFIRTTYDALAACVRPEQTNLKLEAEPSATAQPSPSSHCGSILPEGIVSCIDGRVYKTLKRHLTAHGHTPETYRKKYGLDEGYPMVAPSYAARRAAIATRIGLGRPGFIADLQQLGEPQASNSRIDSRT